MDIDRKLWSGRVDAAEGARARRWHQVVQPLQPGLAPGVALLGFACDAGVRRNQGRPGAAAGPAAIRGMAAALAWHGDGHRPLIDAGDVACSGDELEAAQATLGERVAGLLRAGHLPLLLGGGHEIAWGSFQGVAQAFPDQLDGYGVLNFDAHFDLRRPPDGRGHSGTPFLQISEALALRHRPFRYLCAGVSEASNTQSSFDTAHRLGVSWIGDEELAWPNLQRATAVIDAFLDRVKLLQLSICLDALPGWAAPGVSAPAARGVAPDLFFALLDHVLRRVAGAPAGTAPRLVLAEIAECNPAFDRDDITSRLAARIAFDVARTVTAPGIARPPATGAAC